MYAKGVSPYAVSTDESATTPLDRMTSMLLFSPSKPTATNGTEVMPLQTQQVEPQLVARVDVEALDHVILPALLDALLEKFQEDNSGYAGVDGQGVGPSAAIVNGARSRRNHHRDRQMPLEDIHPTMVTSTLNTCHVLLYRVAGQLSYVNALAHAARASKLVELGMLTTC